MDFENLSEQEKIESLLSLKFKPSSLKFEDDFVMSSLEV